MEYNWFMDIPSETDIKIRTVLKMDCLAELQKIHIKQSGTVYTFAVILSSKTIVDVHLTDEYLSKYEPGIDCTYSIDTEYKVGSRTVTTTKGLS